MLRVLLSIGLLALAGCARTDGADRPIGAAATATPTSESPGRAQQAAPDSKAPASAVASARYSPFAVRLDGHATFDVVTFKDVSRVPNDPALQIDELMAETFAAALRHGRSGLMSEVIHEPSLLDPGNHVFCDQRHLYVDFWRTGDAGQWGYSLWSGCGEDDRFAWQEVDGRMAYDLAAQIEVVVDDISERLAAADRRSCHQRNC